MIYYPQPLGTSMKKMSAEEINEMLKDLQKIGKHDRNAATDALEAALFKELLTRKNKKTNWIKGKVRNAPLQ